MPAKKSSTKKTAIKKSTFKKTASKKIAPKRTNSKKPASKKVKPGKAASKKTAPQKKLLKKVKSTKAKREKPQKLAQESIELIQPETEEEFPETGDCMCRQKKPNGKFFCFRLIQGRWVQSSVVPFPTKELCEEVCC